MNTINIICVDDQPEVLDSVMRDLRPLSPCVRVEDASGAEDCLKLMDQIHNNGDYVALVITDQVMPGSHGTDLLTEIRADKRFAHTRCVMLTGQATHSDTLNAINECHVDNYLEKPWKSEKLLEIAKRLLTLYVLDNGLDYRPLMSVLDPVTLFSKLR
ncbi:MAG: response regulator [Akkermansia sp.]